VIDKHVDLSPKQAAYQLVLAIRHLRKETQPSHRSAHARGKRHPHSPCTDRIKFFWSKHSCEASHDDRAQATQIDG